MGCCHPAGPEEPGYNGFLLTRDNMLALRNSVVGVPVSEEHAGPHLGAIDAVWINKLNEYIVDGHVDVKDDASEAVAQKMVSGILKGLSLGMTNRTVQDNRGRPLLVLGRTIDHVSVVEEGDLPGTDIVTVASRYGLDPNQLRLSQAEDELQAARQGHPFDAWAYFTEGSARTVASGTTMQVETKEPTPPPPAETTKPAAAPEPDAKRQKTAEGARVDPTQSSTPITIDNARYAKLLELEANTKKMEEDKAKVEKLLAVERQRVKEWSEAADSKDPALLKRKREEARRRAVEANLQRKILPAKSALEQALKGPLDPAIKESVQQIFSVLQAGVENPSCLQADGMLERATQISDVVTAASSTANRRATEAEALLQAARAEASQYKERHESLDKMWKEYKAKEGISNAASQKRATSGIWGGVPAPKARPAETPVEAPPTYGKRAPVVPLDTSFIPTWVRPARKVTMPQAAWIQQSAQEIRNSTMPGLRREEMLKVGDDAKWIDVPGGPAGYFYG